MEKAKRILQKLKEGKSIRQIAIEEKINRYSVSLIKQTAEIYEEKIQNLDKEVQQLTAENKKLKENISRLKNKKCDNFYPTILGIIIGIIIAFLIQFLS
ncbi:MAG: hypothetical protein Q9M89_01645 [Persephonella sp.]|nr:hypothetical protein [Persephonella sp.]